MYSTPGMKNYEIERVCLVLLSKRSLKISGATIGITMQQSRVKTPLCINNYVFRGVVGEGSFAKVCLIQERSSNQLFACKVIPLGQLKTPSTVERFENEIRIIQQLNHPGIVQLYDLFKDENNYYIKMELCTNGELFQYIIENGRLSELESKYFLKQILDALQYVHSLGIVHRDIKPENLLISADGQIKISDFGLSRFVNSTGLADTPCGSPCYASPECIKGGSYDGRKSDIWSVGVVAYAMVTGELPWTRKNQIQLFDQICKGDYIIPSYVSDGCRHFIHCLMEPNPEIRYSIQQALTHPWIASAPAQRVLNNETHLRISLKYLDRFFGRDQSEVMIEDPSLVRSTSVVNTSIDETLRNIGQKPKERNTARVAANNILFRKKPLGGGLRSSHTKIH